MRDLLGPHSGKDRFRSTVREELIDYVDKINTAFDTSGH